MSELVEMVCPHCGQPLRMPKEHAGKKAQCGTCQGVFATNPLKPASNAMGGAASSGGSPVAGAVPPSGSAGASLGGSDNVDPSTANAGNANSQNPFKDPYRSPQETSHAVATNVEPHRGVLILVFAILGWAICPVFSVAACIMGNGDLTKIKARRMDPEGKGITQAGVIIAIVQLVLTGIGLLFGLIFLFIGAVANA